MSEVFSKTAKGQDEIKTRSGGLSQRVRQVLIFVDGKRDLDMLRTMLPAEGLADTLQTLQQQGYIDAITMPAEQAAASASPPVAPTAPAATEPAIAFRGLPPEPGSKELELARNFMMNTLKSFTGPYATLSLVEKIDAAQSHAEMRGQFDNWMQAIIETRDGKRRADELRRALLEII